MDYETEACRRNLWQRRKRYTWSKGALGCRIQQPVDDDTVTVVMPYFIQSIKQDGDQVEINGKQSGKERTLLSIDKVIVNTGNRQNFNLIQENGVQQTGKNIRELDHGCFCLFGLIKSCCYVT